jgi:hypothetical protein
MWLLSGILDNSIYLIRVLSIVPPHVKPNF